MMKHLKQALILLLAVLTLGGCSANVNPGGSGSTSPPIPMGRYVETEITPPIPPEAARDGLPMAIVPHADGSVDCFLRVYIPTESEEIPETPQLVHYRSPDGGDTWEPQDTGWVAKAAALCGLPESGVAGRPVVRNITMAGDVIYCTVPDVEFVSRLLKIEPGGKITEIPVSGWRGQPQPVLLNATKEGVGVLFEEGVAALYHNTNGMEILSASADYGYRYRPARQPAAFMDDQIGLLMESELLLYGQGVPKAYDLPQKSGGMALCADGEAYYAASHEGVVRLGHGMSSFEPMMTGSLYQYSDPNRDIECLSYQPETDTFYMALRPGSLGEKRQIYRYAYDPQTPRKPERQLRVLSLENSGTVRRAALDFQMENPSVSVDYRCFLPEGQTLTPDIIRAYEQALSDNPPDVMILDGLDVEKYTESGTLAPLTLPEPERYFPIVRAYGAALYAVPTRFRVLQGGNSIGSWNGLEEAAMGGTFSPETSFAPAVVAAVNTGGQQEMAAEFVLSMLSDPVQRADYGDGLPLSISAFEQQAEAQKEFGFSDGETEAYYTEVKFRMMAK